MVRDTARTQGSRLELLFESLTKLPSAWKRRNLIADQLFLAGVQVTHVVLLVGLFTGMILSLQTGLYLSTLGQQDQIGLEGCDFIQRVLAVDGSLDFCFCCW